MVLDKKYQNSLTRNLSYCTIKTVQQFGWPQSGVSDVFFNINTSNGVPVYEQIARQIVFAVANRGIEAGELVPSVRILSRELAVNPNTVARAYRQLQDAGVLETVRGEGLAVTRGASQKCKATRKKLVGERILSVLQEARQSQLTEGEIKALFADSLAASKKLADKNRIGKEG